MENENFFASTAGIITIVLVVICCCCFIVFAGGLGGLLYIGSQVTPQPGSTPFDFNFDNSTPTPVALTRVPVDAVSTETLKTVQGALVPINNRRDLACRLQGKCDVPETLPSGPYKEGDKLQFWLTNTDNAKSFQINATLKYVTDHAYFWVEDGVKYSQKDAQKMMDTFENKIYPTDREFFGSEWTPGVDNDPHIYIVYGRGIGTFTAGYFGSSNEYHPSAAKYSNAHEMYVFNADNSPLNDSYTTGVLAHEFQHMIHWYQDANETALLNEGFADLAFLLNGYSVGGADYEYISDTDLQLTDWGSGAANNGPHYGANFLFVTYFLDRFGEDATKALVHNQLNGLESVDDTLRTLNVTDKVSGQIVSANDFFMDWAATNYLQDGSVGDGRYVYHNYSEAPKAGDTETISNCPTENLTRTVRQYGVDYIHFVCNGTHTLHFEGSTQVGLLPVDAYSGKYAFWTNKGDQSDMTLTREFDFTNVTGPLTLKYRTWYDIEKDYDYVYAEASTDGKVWQILKTPSGTDSNPSGNSYGWGYNDKSNDWIEESVDLSQYKGQKVQIRFEYVTDDATNGEGFMIDDISIPEINYSIDFEADDGGWQGAGFVRVENVLPQTFRLALVNKKGEITVQTLTVNPDQTAEINVDLSDATLIVSGTTPFTREDGHYSVTVK